MLRHVFWDLGGTLVDTYPALDAALAGVVRSHGGSIDETEVAKLTRKSTGHAIEELSSRFDIPAEEFEAANEALKVEWSSDPAPAMEGAAALIEAVRAAGGVPVFAHPGAQMRGRIVSDAVVEELVAAGLAGLEVGHRDHDPAQRERLSRLATRLGLFMTGSSDYHGTGKTNLLGENTTAREVFEEIERRGRSAVVRP